VKSLRTRSITLTANDKKESITLTANDEKEMDHRCASGSMKKLELCKYPLDT